jgi:prevent-host-death family protein
MAVVASRDLRNHTAEILRKVARGDRVTITVNGMPVAELAPVTSVRRPSMPRSELATVLARHQADAGLRDDLDALTADTTDDLGPLG